MTRNGRNQSRDQQHAEHVVGPSPPGAGSASVPPAPCPRSRRGLERYAQVVPGAEDACIEALGYLGCAALGHGSAAPQQVVVYWTALAVSGSTLRAGASHGEPSQQNAEQTAVANCRRQGSTDCKVVEWAWNKCLALAISYPAGPVDASAGEDRDAAATGALAQCQKSGGSHCVIVAAPCARDNPQWSAPLPLPPGTSTGRVDPNLAGTWEFNKNPGRWIWRISPAGTYEFHSEAGDGAPSHAGTISVSGGLWSIHAVNIPVRRWRALHAAGTGHDGCDREARHWHMAPNRAWWRVAEGGHRCRRCMAR